MNLRNISLFLGLLLIGCQKAVEDDQSEVSNAVACRVGYYNEVIADTPLDGEKSAWLALSCNPKIWSVIENIGIAQADLVEASTIENPFFEVMFPLSKGHCFDKSIQFSVIQNVVDICLRPARERAAQASLEAVKAEAAHEIIEIACSAEEAFYRLKAQELLLKLICEKSRIAIAQASLSRIQFDQGAVSAYALKDMENRSLNAQEVCLAEHVNLIAARGEYEKLIGNPCSYTLIETLPQPLPEENLSCLQELAFEKRYDLLSLKWARESLCNQFSQVQWWAFTELAAGVEADLDFEDDREVGPIFSGRIPIFRTGQAERMRLHALYEQMTAEIEALEVKIAVDLKSANAILQMQKERAELLSGQIQPLNKKLVEEAEEYYRSMAISEFELLDRKKEQLDSEISMVEALRDYWLARVELKRILGGSL